MHNLPTCKRRIGKAQVYELGRQRLFGRKHFAMGYARRSHGSGSWSEPTPELRPKGQKRNLSLYVGRNVSHRHFRPQTRCRDGRTDPSHQDKKRMESNLRKNLPLLANHADKIAVIRGMTSTKGAHQQGNYFMHTSYAQRATIVHPSMGAWMTKLDGRFNPTLPGAVVVNGGSRHPLSGFLPSAHQPLAVGNPNEGLRNCEMLRGFNDQRFEKSLALSNKLDRGFVEKYDLKKVRAYSDMYDDAVRLMKSQDPQAFDLFGRT